MMDVPSAVDLANHYTAKDAKSAKENPDVRFRTGISQERAASWNLHERLTPQAAMLSIT
jgi:hypothetical protein